MADLNRDDIHRELTRAPANYRALLAAAACDRLPAKTDGTRWTNREMLFHLLLGYLVVRSLLPLVRLVSRLPPGVGRRFAATLNAGARPFHLVNFLGSVAGGHALSLPRMAGLFDRTCAGLARGLAQCGDADLRRGMPFPKRWDPFFTDHMTILDVYHYPLQHYQFHRGQLTLDTAS